MKINIKRNIWKITDHVFYSYSLRLLSINRNSMRTKFFNLKYKMKYHNYKASITIYSEEPDKYKKFLRKHTPVYHIVRLNGYRSIHRRTLYNKSKNNSTKTLQQIAHGH